MYVKRIVIGDLNYVPRFSKGFRRLCKDTALYKVAVRLGEYGFIIRYPYDFLLKSHEGFFPSP